MSQSIVSLIAVFGALVLAWRGLQSHGLPRERLLKMAGLWVVIIVGLVLVLRALGA